MIVSNKKYSAQDVVSFKLTSGEEIICRIKEELLDSWIVTKAMTVVMQQKGLGLVPSLFSMAENGEMSLIKTGVIAHSKTDAQIAARYRESTSMIAPAQSGLVGV
jgi:hypothetical protein